MCTFISSFFVSLTCCINRLFVYVHIHYLFSMLCLLTLIFFQYDFFIIISYFQGIPNKLLKMRPCHQSRFVIDLHTAITASFDEHGRISSSQLFCASTAGRDAWPLCVYHHHRHHLAFLGPSLSKRQWNVYPSSYHSHFDVVGLRRQRRRESSRYVTYGGPWPIRKNGCAMLYYHITAIFDELGCGMCRPLRWTVYVSVRKGHSVETRQGVARFVQGWVETKTEEVRSVIGSTRRSQSGCYVCLSCSYHSQLWWATRGRKYATSEYFSLIF